MSSSVNVMAERCSMSRPRLLGALSLRGDAADSKIAGQLVRAMAVA